MVSDIYLISILLITSILFLIPTILFKGIGKYSLLLVNIDTWRRLSDGFANFPILSVWILMVMAIMIMIITMSGCIIRFGIDRFL